MADGTLTRPAATLSHRMGEGVLPRAFAVACDGGYYPGLVALLNSIWAYHGNRIPVFIYHRDMSRKQLTALARHPVGTRLHRIEELAYPSAGMWEAKQQVFAHCLGRARCVYLVDADVVLASEMDDVFELARMGRIVASADGGGGVYDARYVVYGSRLPGTRYPYLNSGALCLDVMRHWDLVGLWAFAANYGEYSPGQGQPLRLPGHGDQGVFNALAVLLEKTGCYHSLPEGIWCDATKHLKIEIQRVRRDGRLEIWNPAEQARQRLVHCIGPKWWRHEGRAYQARYGDKLRCFEHFAGLAGGG